MHLGTGGRQGGGGLLRAGQTDDLMSGVQEFGDDADPTCPEAPVTDTRMVRLSCDKGPCRGKTPVMSVHDITIASMSVTVITDVRDRHRCAAAIEASAVGNARQEASWRRRRWDSSKSRASTPLPWRRSPTGPSAAEETFTCIPAGQDADEPVDDLAQRDFAGGNPPGRAAFRSRDGVWLS